MADPRVTVLMPAFNASRFIPSAIESVLNQTYDDWELVIIDDASRDDTRTVVRSFHDARIRLVEQDVNSGVASSLNLGLKVARGELVARLDADDIAYPERLSLQVAYLASHPECGVLGTSFDRIDEEGRQFERCIVPCNPTVVRWRLLTWNVLAHSSVMFRRNLALKVGGYDETAHNAEDHALWARLGLISEIAQLPDVLVAYRDNPNGVIRQATRRSGSLEVSQTLFSLVSGSEVPLDVVRCLRGQPPTELARTASCMIARTILTRALWAMLRRARSDDERVELVSLWREQLERLCEIAPATTINSLWLSARVSLSGAGMRGLGSSFWISTARSLAFCIRGSIEATGSAVAQSLP